MNKIHPNQVHIIGSKNSGKTYLMEFLIKWFAERKIKVGAIKHTCHSHPLDKDGSDSNKFFMSGAEPVTFITNEGMSIVLSDEKIGEEILRLAYKDCNLLLVESFKNSPNDKIVINPEDLEFNKQNVIAAITKDGDCKDYVAFKHDDNNLGEFLVEKYLL